MSKIIIGEMPGRDRDRALEIAFKHGITENGDNPQYVIDQMVRALTGCHKDGRESKEYHTWVRCFGDYRVQWDTGERIIAKILPQLPHLAIGYPANRPEYDEDGLKIKATGYETQVAKATGQSVTALHSPHIGKLSEEIPDAPRLQNTGMGGSILANAAGETKVQPIGYGALAGEDIPCGIGVTGIGVECLYLNSVRPEAPPDRLIGDDAGRDTVYMEGYPLGRSSTLECPWRGCGKDINIAADSCGTGTTWSLYQCRSCGKLCASGNHIPTSVQMDPDVLIIK